MPDRKSLVTTLWLTFSLVLLALVLVAPIRSVGFVTASPLSNGPPREFDLSPGPPPTYLTPAVSADAILQVNALTIEDEEQDRAEAVEGPRVSFLIPSSFRKIPDREAIAPLPIPSHYPLRC